MRIAMAKGRTVVRELPFPQSVEAVFLHLANRPHVCWLDSAPSGDASGGPRDLSRWSVLTSDPVAVLTSDRGSNLLQDSSGRRLEASAGSPFPLLQKVLKDFALPKDENAKLAFGPGMIGYLAYDLGTWIEPTVPQGAREDIALPAMYLPLYDHLLLLDHEEQRAWGIAAGLEHSSKPPDVWLEEMAEWVAAGTGIEENIGPPVAAEPQFSCNFSRREYLMAVAQAREYIAAGDIFQVNLSQRFTSECDLEPAQVYLRLRRENPAPFSAFLGLGGGRAVLSSSPELFLKVRDGRVLTRPIKGTRPRRPTDEPFNAVMQEQLLASEKDAAELVMIVDLERNDLGRVCDYGSIHVTESRALEAYASVHHLVAGIEGTLFADADLVDLLKATFPGGSITGAPKVRAMQIIDELEPTRRSVYTGAIGHIGLDGRMELNIAIRTLIQMGRQVHMQVGGGIVADSTPGGEYDETLDKARSMFAALGRGEM